MSIVKLHHNWYSMENAHQIIPRIWLGNYFSAQDAQFIHDNGISVVINCSKDIPFLSLDDVYKYRVPVHDNLEMDQIMDMAKYLEKIVPIIRQHYMSGRTILIHCAAGVQRSAIVTLSYLYQYHVKDMDKAISLIKKRRPIVFSPYMNFRLAFYKYFNIPTH